MDNWLLIIVATVFLVCIVVGYIRGFLKLGLSLLSTVLTIVIVAFLSPYVADALAKYTPVDDFIEERCVAAFMPEISQDQLADLDLSGTPLENLSQDQLQNLNDLDWDRLGIKVQDILDVIGEIPRDIQISEIENAPLPEFLKDQLMDNNNEASYNSLGVSSFPQYVAAFISGMVLNILSFLVTFVIAVILVKALMVAVNIIGELPVLGLINHIGGAALGLVLGLVIVWIGFLIMTLLYATEAGSACFAMVEKSSILTLLYDTNPLLTRFLGL